MRIEIDSWLLAWGVLAFVIVFLVAILRGRSFWIKFSDRGLTAGSPKDNDETDDTAFRGTQRD